ncbi:MAG: hypothetical protein GY713_12730 [Actinomycetia bacterium]|nr:hypothetical protein [Actinomycetes bacterium]
MRVPVGDHLVVVNPETGAIVVELPGVGPEEPFDLHVVDNTMWLLPWDLVPARTYLLEDT